MSDLQAKLKRLGVVKGARQLKSVQDGKPRAPLSPVRPNRFTAGDPPTLEKLIPNGRLISNDLGKCFAVDRVYPLNHVHGNIPLNMALEQPLNTLCALSRVDGVPQVQECLFLDTETSGLAGAGTVAFMVGVGFFEGTAYVVRQYFMRDFSDESAMLVDLAQLVKKYPNLVTFNGRTFDIPLLQTRYLMNRLLDPFDGLLHLDLLHPARRIWRRRLGSVALGALEPQLLGVPRTHEDVPGFLIPGMYHDYLRSNDPRELVRVFYHNQIDIVSMVTLLGLQAQTVNAPMQSQFGLDGFSLGKWFADRGEVDSAETTLRHALTLETDLDTWHAILLELATLLKRQDRRPEAEPLWLQVAHTSTQNVTAHIELAMLYEWHLHDLKIALDWTEQAVDITPMHEVELLDELHHRKARLERKMVAPE